MAPLSSSSPSWYSTSRFLRRLVPRPSRLPVFLSYVLSSFMWASTGTTIIFQATEHVSGKILWANLHLLFWLSLAPFATAWMGQDHQASAPAALYGFVLLFAGIAYFILTTTLIAHHRKDSALAISVGNDRKSRLRIAIHSTAIPLAFWKVGSLRLLRSGRCDVAVVRSPHRDACA
jgi:uncharacterized membrane protein